VNVSRIKDFNQDLEIRLGRYQDFESTGPIGSNDELLLTYASNKHFADLALSKRNIAALFIRPEDVPKEAGDSTLFLTDDPQAAFFRFHNHIATDTQFYGQTRPTVISSNVQIHPSAVIAEQGVVIKGDSVIGPNVVLLEGTNIETGVEICPGTVIGVSGARIVKPQRGKPFRVVHVGGVLIREGTFVGANCVIVRSVWRKMTTIGKNVFVGNLVNVGHNVVVKDNCMLLPGAILCGSAQIDEGAVIAPGAIIANQKHVGRDAWVTMGAVATKDVKPGQRVSGNFAIEHQRLLEHVKSLSRK
jgi:UDP-3-O-[3-hydroxymyristoyl] glucosamine N-acyltransferase